jgi:hypothetical protein
VAAKAKPTEGVKGAPASVRSRNGARNGQSNAAGRQVSVDERALEDLLVALRAARMGDFSPR